MNVTTLIWGNPETWQEITEYNKPLGKVATFSNNGHTLYDAVNSGNLTGNTPITDYSLSWCAFGEESNYCNMRLFVSNTIESTGIKTQTPLNFFMYYINSGVGSQKYMPGTSNYKNILYNGYDPGDTWSNLNDNRYIQPFTDFYIKKCVWVIKVECCDTLSNSNSAVFDFSEYKNNQMANYPYILHIYATPFFGDAGTRTEITTNMAVGSCLNVAPFNAYSLFSTPIGEHFYQDFALTSNDRTANITLFGTPAQTVTGTSSYIFTLGNCKRKTTTPRKTYQDENLNAVLESALKTIACFGFYFVLDINDVQKALDDTAVYMGVIPSDGITHGDYTHGAANRNNLNWNWNKASDSTYDWTKAVDNNSYSKQTYFNVISAIPRTTKQYVINDTGVNALSTELWTCINDIINDPNHVDNIDILDQRTLETFLVNNPIDAIISLKKFPLSSVPKGATSEQIYLGKYQCSTIGYPLAAPYAEYQFEPIDIFPKFGNCFLDFAPYTTMQLYIPFCGTVDLNPADFMGHKLTVKLVVDFITGNVTAYIQADYLVIQTATGTMAVDLPVTGTEQTTINAAYETGVINNRIAQATTVGTYGSNISKPWGFITSPVERAEKQTINKLNEAKSEYDLTHIQMPLRQIGSATPLTGWRLEFTARLIIYYPESDIIKFNPNNTPYLDADKITEFGHLKGFATVESGPLSNYPGFTVCNDVNLDGITATDTEKDMIMQALQTGVYI